METNDKKRLSKAFTCDNADQLEVINDFLAHPSFEGQTQAQILAKVLADYKANVINNVEDKLSLDTRPHKDNIARHLDLINNEIASVFAIAKDKVDEVDHLYSEEINTLQDQVTTLKADLMAKTEEITSISNDSKAQIDALKVDLATKNKKIEELSKANKDLTTQTELIDDIKNQRDQAQADLDACKIDIKAKDKEISALTRDNGILEERANNLQNQVETLQNQVASLNKVLQTLDTQKKDDKPTQSNDKKAL